MDDFVFGSEAAEDYGDGMFVVPFSASSLCTTQFCLPKSEWLALDEDVDLGTVTSWNDHVLMVENEQVLRFSGSLLFQADLEKLKADADAKGIAAVAADSKLTVEIDEVEFPEDAPD